MDGFLEDTVSLFPIIKNAKHMTVKKGKHEKPCIIAVRSFWSLKFIRTVQGAADTSNLV